MSLHFELRRQKAGQYDPYNDYNSEKPARSRRYKDYKSEKSARSRSYNNYDCDYYPVRWRNKASNKQSAQSNFTRGLSHERRGETRKAIDAFTKAITYDHLYVEAWFCRAKAYEKLEKIEDSIKDYSQVISLNPQYATVWFYRGKAYQKQGNLKQAIADYSEAIKYNSQYAEAYGNRGDALIKLYKQNPLRSQFYHLERGRNDLQIAAKLFQSQGNIVSYEKALLLLQRYV